MVYIISYKTLTGVKSLCIRFYKVDRFTKVCDGTRYLVLLSPEKYDAVYNRSRYHISQKHSIKYVFSHNYAWIKIDSNVALPLRKDLVFHNVATLIKSVLNKNQNRCYCNIL